MCIIWPQRLAVELNVISCVMCPCFKSLVPGSGRKAVPSACLLLLLGCCTVAQAPGKLRVKSKRTCEANSRLHIWQHFHVKLQNDILHRTLSSPAMSLYAAVKRRHLYVWCTGAEKKSPLMAEERSERLSDGKQWFIKQTIGWNHPLTWVK